MLTINADAHELMRQFHKPVDEKRMVVILEPDQYAGWLEAPSGSGMDYMRPYAANLLTATAPTPVEGVLF
jgi:putative SOS response-associated peptidase YedK